MYGYCERHNIPYEIKPANGSWVYECPKCRKAGLLDVYTSNTAQMNPVEEWTQSSETREHKDNKQAGETR